MLPAAMTSRIVPILEKQSPKHPQPDQDEKDDSPDNKLLIMHDNSSVIARLKNASKKLIKIAYFFNSKRF